MTENSVKKLHLIRHAKSSWNNSYLADIDRPLNERGMRSCQTMAAKIAEAGCPFTDVFCSPAVRARSTIEQISETLADRRIDWQVDNALYTFDFQDLLRWCRGVDDVIAQIVIIGHNPAMTDFINEMSDRTIENLPTCGYAQLWFETQSWQTLPAKSAKLVSFLKPKMFMD